jgi:putative membrane protein
MMMHGIGALVGLFVTGGLIVGGIGLLAWLARRAGTTELGLALPWLGSGPQASPREILQARYARGEITREQYLEILPDVI